MLLNDAIIDDTLVNLMRMVKYFCSLPNINSWTNVNKRLEGSPKERFQCLENITVTPMVVDNYIKSLLRLVVFSLSILYMVIRSPVLSLKLLIHHKVIGH